MDRILSHLEYILPAPHRGFLNADVVSVKMQTTDILAAQGVNSDDSVWVVDLASINGFSNDTRLFLYQTTATSDKNNKDAVLNTLSLVRFNLRSNTLEDVSFSMLGNVRLDGSARKIAVGDLNGDGVDDFAFALSKEDGRLWENGWEAHPQVLLSNVERQRFDLVEFGTPNYYHSAFIAMHPLHGPLLHLDYEGGFWSYHEQELKKVDLDWDFAWQNPTFFSIGSDFFAVSEIDALSGSVALLKQNGSIFNVIDSVSRTFDSQIVSLSFDPFAGPDDVVATVPIGMVDIGGDDVILFGAFQIEHWVSKAGEHFVAVQTNGFTVSEPLKVIESIDGSLEPIYSVFNSAAPKAIYDIYRIDEEKLIPVRSNFSDLDFSFQNINFFDFRDINGDGIPDFIFYPITPSIENSVMIYASNGDFNYDRIPLDTILARDLVEKIFEGGQRILVEGNNLDDMLFAIAPGDNGFLQDLNENFKLIVPLECCVESLNYDLINGGSGFGWVIYDWPTTEIEYFEVTSEFTLVIGSVHGRDTLTNIGRLRFTDKDLALDIDGVAGQAYRIYKAAFDRAPDLTGLGYWINAMDNGAALTGVAGGFIASTEFQNRYGNVNDTDFIRLLYENVLDRQPDTAGYAFWQDAMGRGLTREALLAEFSESPENKSNVAGLIANGIEYTPFIS